ncbi:thioredoxin [Candidatus Solirubrobacter pratensis]|uniref:thioredoxin n=1 Tax=Candidatus Solirubrobacter pratensis TaxID=1298857 RepID=UPI000422268B|nr:thioredoxin [Candidatus Solirubrobacter pratensis]
MTIIACPHCGKKNRVGPRPEGVPRCGNCHNLLPWIVEAAPETFDAEIAASVPVLVDFWAPWCGPCRMVSPAVEAHARNRPGELKVVKLNVDTAPDIGARYQAMSIPLLVLIRGGQEVDRMVGAVPERQLRDWLDRTLAAAA